MVLADGTFDPIHCGHVRYLRAAAELGSTLIVNIAPDAAICAKGRAPFQTQIERAETIFALGCVDDVCLGELATVIREKKPRVLVKGADWRDKLPTDVLRACQETGTEIVYTNTPGKTSTERLSNWRDVWSQR